MSRIVVRFTPILILSVFLFGCSNGPEKESATAKPQPHAVKVDTEGLASYIDSLPRWEDLSTNDPDNRLEFASSYRQAALVFGEYSNVEIEAVLHSLYRRAGASRSNVFILDRFLFEFPEKPLTQVTERSGFKVTDNIGGTSPSWPVGLNWSGEFWVTDSFGGTSGRFEALEDFQDAATKFHRRPQAKFKPEYSWPKLEGLEFEIKPEQGGWLARLTNNSKNEFSIPRFSFGAADANIRMSCYGSDGAELTFGYRDIRDSILQSPDSFPRLAPGEVWEEHIARKEVEKVYRLPDGLKSVGFFFGVEGLRVRTPDSPHWEETSKLIESKKVPW